MAATAEDILAGLDQIVATFSYGPDQYDCREMSCRGASDEDIARDEGRSDGREEVLDYIRTLLIEVRV